MLSLILLDQCKSPIVLCTMQAGLTAYDIASTEGHTDVCQELLTQKPS